MAGVMLIAVAAIFAVVYAETGNELRRQIDRDLAGDTGQLTHALAGLPRESPPQIASTAQRLVGGQPYRAASTLLFVVVPGQRPASNHRELLTASGQEPGESSVAQAKENVAARALVAQHLGYFTQAVPDVGRVRILKRPVNLGGLQVVVGAGEPLAAVERAQHEVTRSLLLAGALALMLALLASYLAGARVSAPLRRMATIATRVDAGDLEPRIAPEPAEGEIRVLASAFNHMLDRLSEAFAGQRQFLADASHELRTPLTVIRGQVEVLAAQDNPPEEEVRRVERLVQAEVTRMSRLVDDLLVLAHAQESDFLRLETIRLRSFVADLWDGMSLTAARRYQLGAVPDVTLRADPDRLAQALRNLIRNAIEHTQPDTGRVSLEVERLTTDEIRFRVLDDGPGIPEAERERVFERLHRTDASRARTGGGTGLGLTIVRAIARAHGGEARACPPGPGGGACVELVLPVGAAP